MQLEEDREGSLTMDKPGASGTSYDALVVMTTFENEAQARDAIDILMGEKLVACAQTVGIKSHYVWNGETCHDPEVLVLLKTPECFSQGLKERLLEIHPYETPEIIEIPARASDGYFKWMLDCTGQA